MRSGRTSTAPLPPPHPDAQAASRALCALIAQEIAAGGWLPFSRYMELALYAPGMGYYTGGARKFGSGEEGGDFVTAPELTPLFGQALARQVAQVTAASAPVVLEAGAGSGRLAADLLDALDWLGAAPERYLILELSGELRARQRATIEREAPRLADRVEWLDRLPASFAGCVVANELLDALPVHAVSWRERSPPESLASLGSPPGGPGNTRGGPACFLMERGIALGEADDFVWAERPAPDFLAAAMARLPVEPPFEGEIGLVARAWVAEWGRRLEKGALLLIDYGLPRHELYHAQRDRGTLRCHWRQRSHDDPFWWPGLSDITAHVDFTAVAEAGFEAGLDVLGYTSQSAFLINCGIGELLAARRETHPKAAGAANVLLAPAEMGELFKAIALGRGLAEPLLGFARGDRTHSL